MSILKTFVPDNFEKLNREKREEIIQTLCTFLCHKLKIKPLKVIYDQKMANASHQNFGFYSYDDNKFIYLNEALFDSTKQNNLLSENDTKVLPYHLIDTLAHECYHHYQYTFVENIINNEIIDSESKIFGYFYFIFFYRSFFADGFKKNNASVISTLNSDELYLFSPCEIEAREFGKYCTQALADLDPQKNNFNTYCGAFTSPLDMDTIMNSSYRKALIMNNIDICAKLAINYLKDNQKDYQTIDINELKKAIEIMKGRWKTSQIVKETYLNKINLKNNKH